ncbi:MAG TPA: bacteriohemerythrin [Longilinea sp.]|nr:bacteriohemerythrin [Longilinea sp.]
MEPIQWSEQFSVGVEELDHQHRRLIQLINRLLSPQEPVDTRSEAISDTLLAMTRYAEEHFKTEEALMQEYDYPGLEDQQRRHRAYRKKTVDLSVDTMYGMDSVPETLLTYLRDWWVQHILEEDMKYKDFFAARAVK